MGLWNRGKGRTSAPAAAIVPGRSGPGRGPAAKDARAAVFSGAAFAVLFTLGLVLVNQIPRLDSPDSTYTAFYANGSGGVLVTVGLYLVPFAGIAYLWFMMAFRALLDRPADFTQGLQLASGVVFVCMLFAGTAAVGAVALMLHFASVPAPPVSVDRVLASVGYGLVFVYGVRVAGMFTITTTTLARRAGLMPRWLAVLSYLMAAFLLVTTTTQPATLLVYPAWVLLVSLALLRSARVRPGPRPPPGNSSNSDRRPRTCQERIPLAASPGGRPPARQTPSRGHSPGRSSATPSGAAGHGDGDAGPGLQPGAAAVPGADNRTAHRRETRRTGRGYRARLGKSRTPVAAHRWR